MPSATSSTSPARYRNAAQMELQRFSSMTGGQAFFPTSLKELDGLYEKILKEMSARYIIGYTSTDTRSDGSWRPVEIKAEAARPEERQSAHPARVLRGVAGGLGGALSGRWSRCRIGVPDSDRALRTRPA